MQVNLTRKQLWFGIAGILILIGGCLLCFHTGPKLMGAADGAGASIWDLLGAWGPLLAGIAALVKAMMSGDVIAIVSAGKSLAANPKCQALIQQAEQAMLAQIASHHPAHPEVLAALQKLYEELGKITFAPQSVAKQGG